MVAGVSVLNASFISKDYQVCQYPDAACFVLRMLRFHCMVRSACWICVGQYGEEQATWQRRIQRKNGGDFDEARCTINELQ